MTRDDIIGRIITLVHEEVRKIPADVDHVAEGRQSAPSRTAIVERLSTDVAHADPATGLIELMEILNDRKAEPPYPEVRLLQQWQHMSIVDAPMDDYYTADVLFSKVRADVVPSPSEMSLLSKLVNVHAVHPWPNGFTLPSSAAVGAGGNTPQGVTSQVVQAADAVGVTIVQAPLVKSSDADVAVLPAQESQTASAAMEDAAKRMGFTVVQASLGAPATAADYAGLPQAVTDDATVDEPEDQPEERVLRTPVAAYQEKRGMIEDVALANGLAVVSGKEWRAMKMPRTDALLVADFDFSTIEKEGVGRAAYLLVAPESKNDIRIELKSQSTSGSAGDKLPTSLLRLVNAAKTQSYGAAVVGVVGLQFFAPEALSLAREVAGKSSRVQLVEGPENFLDAVQQKIDTVKALHAAVAPAPVAPTVAAVDNSGPSI